MRRIILLIAVVLFTIACQRNKLPEGVIAKDNMLNVMLDMQLSDAALNQVYNSDTMKMQARSRYDYVFKKYKIDSAAFTNSLKYYSQNPAELDSMYSIVSDSLTRLQESITPKLDTRRAQGDNLYGYVLKSLKVDSTKSYNTWKYYTSDAKKMYGKYNQTQDSLKHLQDSIKGKLKADKIKNLKETTKIKNDLSTK